jgi:hypothetical protein
MKECKNTVCFGPGFRKSSVVRSVSLFPSQRPEDIALQVDPIESFRFEKVVTSDGESYRVRSDVSMLLHAADLANRVGSSAAQYFMDSRRPRSSSIQEALDKLNPSDDELLSMVKSRHLQHPSEILAWVDSINELAEDMKSEALKQMSDKQMSDDDKNKASSPDTSVGDAGSVSSE